MCREIPARLIGGDTGHPDLAMVDMRGVSGRSTSPCSMSRPGEWVSLRRDWICDRLTQRQLRALRGFTLRHLDMVNHRVEHPGTLSVPG